MNERRNSKTGTAEPVAIGSRLAASETFKELFRDGMGLVEAVAAYLDGAGRKESRELPRPASIAYASESMRLTTRLMQMASWLLLQRAVNDGEMPIDQARQERAKVRLRGFQTAVGGPDWADLPPTLRSLIERSVRLQERIRVLDEAIYLAPPSDTANPVAEQMDRLAAAFPTRAAG